MWSHRAERWLDLPDGALTGESHIEIDARRRVSVDGLCEIVEYTDTVVRLHTKSGELRLQGDRLVLEQYGAIGTVVSGQLLSLEFL